jgi:hypothetical protein
MGRLTEWQAKAKQAAASVRAEYEAGKRGDDTPAQPIWATPQQQLDSLLAVFGRRTAPTATDDSEVPTPAPSETTEETTDQTNDDRTDAAEEVAEAMRGVDWAGVRAATAERTADATRAMKEMADHVDWAKVQPVAAQISSALIAAIATGQLGVGGRLGSTVARAITNQGGLGQQVAARLQQTSSAVPTDLGGTIAAASREA